LEKRKVLSLNIILSRDVVRREERGERREEKCPRGT
jgi:hypothetical protein